MAKYFYLKFFLIFCEFSKQFFNIILLDDVAMEILYCGYNSLLWHCFAIKVIKYFFLENIENCNPPPNVINGAVIDGPLPSYTSGSSVEYRCNEYYLLSGAKISHCEQGRWSPTPVCLGKREFNFTPVSWTCYWHIVYN